MTQLFRGPRSCAFIGFVLVVSSIAFCYLFGWLDDINKFTLWQAKYRVSAIYNQVKAMKPAISAQLTEESQPTMGLGGTMDCIYIQGNLKYHADQSYRAIVDQFTQEFLALGWQKLTTDKTDETKFYSDNDLSLSVRLSYSETSHLLNKTDYAIQIFYREPRCMGG